MSNGSSGDGVSQGLLKFMAELSPVDREELSEMLRDPRTFLAEDMTDLVAILHQLDKERDLPPRA